VVPSIIDFVALYCDNNGAIAQAKEPKSHQWSKNILRQFYFIRESWKRKDVKIEWVPNKKNLVDHFTKSLSQ
jgi:hypothetical protein